MRILLSMLLLCSLAGQVRSQDGIYGSFLVGQKFINLEPLNDILKTNWGYNGAEFVNNRWTFGGEGHLVLGQRLVIGGRAFGIFDYRKFSTADPAAHSETENLKDLKLTAGMGIANIGFNLFKENRFGIKAYPMVGAGVQSFIFQAISEIDPEDRQFDYVMENNSDYMVTMGKVGFVTDAALGIDWYKPFKHFFTLFPGLDFGLMMHFEVGYSFLPVKLNWRRDVDPGGVGQVEGGPDLQFSGLYLNLGVGLGLSSKK